MATLTVPKHEQKQELEEILEKAANFHGHLGPFLVLGVRMGLFALRELKAKKDNPKLCVTVKTKPSVPFSCVIDGIQVSTNCTVGNRRLRLQSSPKEVSAKFQVQKGNTLTVTLSPAKQAELEKLLSEHPSFQEVESIARNVIFTPESDLFQVEVK